MVDVTITKETAQAFARDALRYKWQASPEETAAFLQTEDGQRIKKMIDELRQQEDSLP